MRQRAARWQAWRCCHGAAVLLWLLLAAPAWALPPEVESALQRARVPPDALSVLLQEAGSGRTVLTHQAQTPVNPASLAKLLTTLAALDQLGPAWSWTTPVWLLGPVNDGVLDDFKVTMSSIRQIAARLAAGEGTLGKLINDDAVYADVRRIAANLGDVSDKLAQGEGTLGKLVNDGQLYADAQAVAANLKDVSGRLAQGEGTLGQLLSADGQASADLGATLAAFRKISESIARGEGSLGKLLADDELYLQFEALLREGRATVDDMRETSPVTTFTSIFFGAF